MPIRLSNFLALSAVAVLLVAAPARTGAETPATKATIKTYSLGKGARKPSGIAIGDVNNDGFGVTRQRQGRFLEGTRLSHR
jgi:hypothetical protein